MIPIELQPQWHPRNTMKAVDATPGSGKKVWWIDEHGHEWEARIADRVRGRGCPVCVGKKILVGVNDLATSDSILAAQWHPTKNNKLKPTDVTPNSGRKVWWQDEHGHEWEATVSSRFSLRYGCPYCSGRIVIPGTTDLLTNSPDIAAEWHPTKNGLLKPVDVTANSSSRKVWWLGTCGHEWEAKVSNRANGNGCPVCSGHKVEALVNSLAIINPTLAAQWHPTKNGTLKPTEITASSNKRIWWVCEAAHSWESPVNNRSQGSGCPVCRGYFSDPGKTDLATTHPEISAQWDIKKNEDLTPQQLTAGSNKKIWWVCESNHSYQMNPNARKRGRGCPTCAINKHVSKAEKEIADFLKSKQVNIKISDREVLGGSEIDIYLPEKKLGIEFNGLYWHSEDQGKDRKYHYNKWLKASEAGVQLVQIWEDDWERNKEIVLNMIAHKAGFSRQEKVAARKTEVVVLDKSTAENFLDLNHIQGHANGSYYLGLQTKADGKLVAVLVAKRESLQDHAVIHIVRYATNATVIGGFTKLLAFVEKKYAPSEIWTFSDHSVSDGGLYANNGFIAVYEVRPDYMYVVNGERRHKFGYRLKKFRDDPTLKYDASLSERELAKLNNLPRIWDAGKTKWIKSA